MNWDCDRRLVKKPICGIALVLRPMKDLSSVLLPWWEEEVEEGEHSPSP